MHGTTNPKEIAENKEMRDLSKLSDQGRLNYARHRQLRHHFGISFQDYNRMFIEQGGCCAICGRHQTEFTRGLHTDHNHATGQVRELLCSNCNTVLGKVHEKVELLGQMAEYLEKWSL